MKDLVRVAVIGCGRWGPNHIRAFSSMRGATVVAAADPDAGQRGRVAQQHPNLPLFADANALLNEGAVDAVVIATPTASHYGLVKAALRAGKHVLCEKPLCETARQGRELAALAKKKKLVLMTGHVFLFNGGIVKLKELVDGGELGKIHYLSAVRTNLGPIRSDVNAAYDLAAHDISVFNWLLGKAPETVSATGGAYLQKGVEDVAFLTLRYPGGVIANIHASWLNPKKVRQAIVVGSKKMATWDDLELSMPVSIYDKGAKPQTYPDYGAFLRLSLWEGDVHMPKIDLQEPLRAQDQAFLDAVRAGKAERSDAGFSVGVVAALEAAGKSLRRGGAPVAL